jgi:adenylate kinase
MTTINYINETVMDLILFGIQGSGKGTQAKIIAEKFNLKTFETGAQLRQLAQEDSDLGKQVKSLIEAGHLVPDAIVIQIVERFLHTLQLGERILFDGVPRKTIQQKAFDDLLKKLGRDFLGVLIEIPEEETIKRLLQRGRNDDTPDSIKNRIEHFKKETVPVIEDYQKREKMITVNGFQPIEKVSEEIISKLSDIF